MDVNNVYLEDISLNITDGTHSTIRDNSNGKGYLLSCKNIKKGKVNIGDSERRIGFEQLEQLRKRTGLNKDDVLITTVGTIGEMAMVEEENPNYDFQRSVGIIKPDKDKVIPKYLYYALKNEIPQIKSLVKGAVQQCLFLGDIKKIQLYLPPLDVQRRQIELLSLIDKKIRVNEKINDNLAEQAQGVLYHFMDEHPYQLQPLSDIAIVIDCLHSKKPSAVEDSAYQLIQLDNIRDDGFLDMSATRYMISQADYENWTRKCEIVEGDCVITNVGRIGAVSQAPYGTKAAMGRNMTCIRLKPEIKLQAYFITVLLSNHMRRQIQSNTDEGTIMGALNVKNIPKLLFPVFESSVMTELEDILFPLRKQIEYNNLQNQNLSQLRDTLLPKLMSGELDVSDIDI